MKFREILEQNKLIESLENGKVIRFLGQYKVSNTYLKDNGQWVICVYNKDNEYVAPFEGPTDDILDEEVEILDSEPTWGLEDRAAYNVLEASGALYKEYTFDIGQAMDFIKQGFKVARRCWVKTNTGMFLYYVPVGSYPARMEVIKGMFENDMVPYEAYIAKKTLRGTVEIWQPSQSDLLAEDYVLVEN